MQQVALLSRVVTLVICLSILSPNAIASTPQEWAEFYATTQRQCHKGELFNRDQNPPLVCCMSGNCVNGRGGKIISFNNGTTSKEVGDFRGGFLQNGMKCETNVRGDCVASMGQFECRGDCYSGYGKRYFRSNNFGSDEMYIYEGGFKNGHFHGDGTVYYPVVLSEGVASAVMRATYKEGYIVRRNSITVNGVEHVVDDNVDYISDVDGRVLMEKVRPRKSRQAVDDGGVNWAKVAAVGIGAAIILNWVFGEKGASASTGGGGEAVPMDAEIQVKAATIGYHASVYRLSDEYVPCSAVEKTLEDAERSLRRCLKKRYKIVKLTGPYRLPGMRIGDVIN